MRKLVGVVLGLALVVLGMSVPVSAGPYACFRWCATQLQNCGVQYPECETQYNACMCGCGDPDYC